MAFHGHPKAAISWDGMGTMGTRESVRLFFILKVHRDRILEDTTAALQKATPEDLRRQLKVVFEGGGWAWAAPAMCLSVHGPGWCYPSLLRLDSTNH